METKLNIAEILKDKPEGTKLWTDVFGSVTLYVVTDVCDAFQVKHHNKEPWFDKEGKLYREGVLCIYPSNSMRDWSKFAWKKGDVLQHSEYPLTVIFESFEDDTYTSFKCKYCFDFESASKWLVSNSNCSTKHFYKVSDEEAKEFIKKVELNYNGKLKMETLEIEKTQPDFKDGDILCVIDNFDKYHYILIYKGQDANYIYRYVAMFEDNSLNMKKGSCLTKPKGYSMRLATEEEKQQLFDALAKENKAWDAEKKQIVDLKPKIELKPFDKVLVREEEYSEWQADFFSNIDEDNRFVCIGSTWSFCIPYNEETAKLIGTTNNTK